MSSFFVWIFQFPVNATKILHFDHFGEHELLFHGVFKSGPVCVKFDVPSFTYLSLHICQHRPLGLEMLMSELKQT